MSEVPSPPSKEALRRRFRAYRNQLDEATYAKKSQAIAERVLGLPELAGARMIHTYWPMTTRREVDTRPLIEHWIREDKQIVLPVVVTSEEGAKGRPLLRHVRYGGPAALRPNAWGLQEPVEGETVPLEAIDAVIVPALGAGRNGHRIGHGYGYYDAFLAHLDVPTICLVYDACLVDEVPAAPHDVPVQVIVTEREVLRPSPAAVTSTARRP